MHKLNYAELPGCSRCRRIREVTLNGTGCDQGNLNPIKPAEPKSDLFDVQHKSANPPKSFTHQSLPALRSLSLSLAPTAPTTTAQQHALTSDTRRSSLIHRRYRTGGEPATSLTLRDTSTPRLAKSSRHLTRESDRRQTKCERSRSINSPVTTNRAANPPVTALNPTHAGACTQDTTFYYSPNMHRIRPRSMIPAGHVRVSSSRSRAWRFVRLVFNSTSMRKRAPEPASPFILTGTALQACKLPCEP